MEPSAIHAVRAQVQVERQQVCGKAPVAWAWKSLGVLRFCVALRLRGEAKAKDAQKAASAWSHDTGGSEAQIALARGSLGKHPGLVRRLEEMRGADGGPWSEARRRHGQF